MRSFLLLVPAVLLAACQKEASRTDTAAVTTNATVSDDGKIDCRIGVGSPFERTCTIERARNDQGLVITVRKPDGGFRRLIATRDGRGVVAADGSEPASVQISGPDMIEVAVGGDAFRLPARIGPLPDQTTQNAATPATPPAP